MRYRILLGVTMVLLAVPTPTPAAESVAGACPDNRGVTVVVDFRDLGGGVGVRCAPGQPRDGFDALRRANVSYQTATKFPGFMCRIANKPASDPCDDAAPMRAYWTYWVAERGGRWCPSNNGAGARTPVQGTLEGWSFSRNKTAATPPPPRYRPDPPVAGAPTPQVSDDDYTAARGLIAPARTVTTSPLPTIPLPNAPARAGSLVVGSGTRAKRASGGDAVRGGPNAVTTTTFDSPRVASADPLRLNTTSGAGGSPLPTVLVGVAALGVAAFGLARRRRSVASDLSLSD